MRCEVDFMFTSNFNLHFSSFFSHHFHCDFMKLSTFRFAFVVWMNIPVNQTAIILIHFIYYDLMCTFHFLCDVCASSFAIFFYCFLGDFFSLLFFAHHSLPYFILTLPLFYDFFFVIPSERTAWQSENRERRWKAKRKRNFIRRCHSDSCKDYFRYILVVVVVSLCVVQTHTYTIFEYNILSTPSVSLEADECFVSYRRGYAYGSDAFYMPFYFISTALSKPTITKIRYWMKKRITFNVQRSYIHCFCFGLYM